MDDREASDPSPEQIAEHCQRIQSGWSEDERVRRANNFCKRERVAQLRHWTPPEFATPDGWL